LELGLFIDESGDFETERGEWLIAGLLCRGPMLAIQSSLSKAFSKQVDADVLPPLAQCHLTEYRRANGVREANSIAERVFSTVFSECADLHPLLAIAVNTDKRRAGSPEQTYRVGVLDLIALVESTLEESDVIASLHVEVATRTKDGERLTTLDRLKEDARNSLRDAIEMGLASRGLLNSFNSNALQLRLRPASQSWGIAVADFLANTAYNRHHPFQAGLITSWKSMGVFTEFQSCGGYEQRRALVAERDQDYVSALSRWALAGIDASTVRTASLERVWGKVLQNTGTTGPLASLQAVIERIARSAPTRTEIDALLLLQDALQSAITDNGCEGHQLLFRLRNRLLLLGNHIGSSDLVTGLIDKQQATLPYLLSDAEALPLAMQFGALIVDSAINDLDFDAALTRAESHYRFVQDFLSAWQLFAGDTAPALPRWKLRAVGTLARILAMRIQPDEDAIAARVHDLLDSVVAAAQHPTDLSRARVTRLMVFSRLHQWGRTLACVGEMLNSELDVFGANAAARAVNEALIAGFSVPHDLIRKVLCEAEKFVSDRSFDHPRDLVLREVALLHFQSGEHSQARRYIEESRVKLKQQNPACALGKWLSGLAAIHNDLFRNRTSRLAVYFAGSFEQPCLALLGPLASEKVDRQSLGAIRARSPY